LAIEDSKHLVSLKVWVKYRWLKTAGGVTQKMDQGGRSGHSGWSVLNVIDIVLGEDRASRVDFFVLSPSCASLSGTGAIMAV
jgi:hypothetical protein